MKPKIVTTSNSSGEIATKPYHASATASALPSSSLNLRYTPTPGPTIGLRCCQASKLRTKGNGCSTAGSARRDAGVAPPMRKDGGSPIYTGVGVVSTPPGDLRPMLATPSDALPVGADWAYEMKWDGVRAIAVVDGSQVRLASRNGNDVTVAYPEIQALGDALDLPAVLDGEIVAVDDAGRASFQRLQARMHLRDPGAIAQVAPQVPVAYMVFDLLWLDGHLVTDATYTQRRSLLEGLALRGPSWQTPPASDDGEQAFAISAQLGFEGVVAKR